ncbi:hypothetical protein ACLB0R_03610 [Sphingomonas sp. GlSt437]|uniref:hypothetical protein n=1 Tax=Sphingomonas sp. GlSt437 TaxID=3389970 RepID=UPI003EBADC19
MILAATLTSNGFARPLNDAANQQQQTIVFSLKQISIDLPSTLPATETEHRIDEFSSAVASITSCDDADQIAEQVHGHVIFNDHVALAELTPALQSTVLNTYVGRATPVFGTRWDGVRVLVVCDRRIE